MERAFVIRPFGKKKAKQKKDDKTEREIDFDAIHKALIGPALTAVGLDGGTTVDIMEAGRSARTCSASFSRETLSFAT